MIAEGPITDKGPGYLLVRGWRCCMTRVTEEVLHVLYLVNFTLSIAIITSGITEKFLGVFFQCYPGGLDSTEHVRKISNVHQVHKLPDLRDRNWTIRVSKKF
jgi:hypothetical protein